MSSYNIPITVFVFRRLETVQMIFERIKEVKPKTLYVFADGAREGREDEAKKVQEVRDFIKNFVDWDCDFHPVYAESNKGYARNIRDGFDSVLSKHEQGIFLEDDAVPSNEFFRYVEAVIDKYKDNKRIQYIAGFNGIGKNDIIDKSYTFGHTAPMSGAIATWADRWNNCDFALETWEQEKKDKNIRKLFFYKELYDFSVVNYENVRKNEKSEWDVQFGYDMLIKDRFAIVPKINLVNSYGNIDASHLASDKAGKMMAEFMSYSKMDFAFPLDEPEEVIWNQRYDKKRQYNFLRVNGNYLQRHIGYVLLAIKNVIYKVLPKKIWDGIKNII